MLYIYEGGVVIHNKNNEAELLLSPLLARSPPARAPAPPGEVRGRQPCARAARPARWDSQCSQDQQAWKGSSKDPKDQKGPKRTKKDQKGPKRIKKDQKGSKGPGRIKKDQKDRKDQKVERARRIERIKRTKRIKRIPPCMLQKGSEQRGGQDTQDTTACADI